MVHRKTLVRLESGNGARDAEIGKWKIMMADGAREIHPPLKVERTADGVSWRDPDRVVVEEGPIL